MTKYIVHRAPSKDDDIVYLTDFDHLQVICNDDLFLESGSWCYLSLLFNVDAIPDDMAVSDLLNSVVELGIDNTEDDNDTQMLQFSVTSREARYQEFLDAVSGVPGHTICSATRNRDASEYTVYLCTFPINPTFDNV